MEEFKFKHFLLLGLFCLISFGASAEDIPNDEIWYTSKDGNAVTPFSSTVFGADIVSNTYTNGKGIIKFNGNVTSIGEMAFYWCSGLTTLTIPNSVTSIGEEAFYHCSNLTSMTIPNSMTSIGKEAFAWCSGLANVTIPNSVTSIGERAFEGCSGLTSMVVESGNTVYDSRDNCNAIIETASNTLIGGCQNTTIPNSVASIGSFAFDGCSGLTSVTIPNSVTSIGDWAFGGCSGLTSVTIPNSVAEIGEWAFYNCRGLTSVTIGISVTKIGLMAFNDCDELTSVTVKGTMPPSINHDTFKDFTKPVLYVPTVALAAYKGHSEWGKFTNIQAIEDTEIPNNEIWYTSKDGIVVTPYNSGAFGANIISNTYTNSKGIIKFDGNVTSIGGQAFAQCSGLTSVTIPNSVTSIGDFAFSNCYELTSVTIPNFVTLIGLMAFAYCSGLTSVTIPNSVISIGFMAFNGCDELTSVYVEWKDADKIPNPNVLCFPFSTCDLYVPTGTKSIYQSKDYWSTFRNIYEYELASALLGDANDDGTVNVNDITTIATYILNGTASPWNENNADANQDGAINVNDITATAAIILGGGSPEEKCYLTCPDNHHPHVVDLGLPSGTKWCCCNVGATTPEGYGGYYAWGETSEKSDYGWDSYSHIDNNTGDFHDIGSDIAGTQYDVAHVKMGGKWRMPSFEQIEEILNNCTRTWTQQNGMTGILVTGKNGGQLFLPFAGYRSNTNFFKSSERGQYWTSTVYPHNLYNVYYLSVDSDNCGQYIGSRLNGMSVRAVCP